MPTPSPKLGLALPSQPDDFSTADVRGNWEKIDAAPGTFICTSTTKPTWGVNQAGREIVEINTGVRRMWTGTTWQATSPEPGDTKWSARIDASEGWLPCDGRILNRSTYSHLFAAIGTAHNTGQEAADSFRIPNVIGRVLIGRSPTAGADYNVMGERRGSTATVLTAGNLPPHSHTMTHSHTINHGHTATSSQIDTEHAHTGIAHAAGAHNHNYAQNNSRQVTGGGAATVSDFSFYSAMTDGAGNHTHEISTYGIYNGVGRYHTPTITVAAHNGSSGTHTGSTGDGPGSSTGVSVMQPSVTLNCFIKI